MTLMPAHLTEDQREIWRAVALAYRRVMRAPGEIGETRAEISRLAQQGKNKAFAAATAEYRRLALSPFRGPA